MDYEPTPMDWVRAALGNAKYEGMTLDDVIRMAEFADTPPDLDNAVNELSETMPREVVTVYMFPK